MPKAKISRAKALVYNNNFATAGGGERSALEVAMCLDQLGYEVILAMAQLTDVSIDQLKASFGIGIEYDWELQKHRSEKHLARAVQEQGIDLFVNHTFCSYMQNTAPLGIYMAMFAYATDPIELENLRTYNVIACISSFTEQYVRRRWGDDLRTAVIPPPISTVHGGDCPFESKERLVLNIGRFNVRGHNKCQLEAVEAFCRLQNDGVLDQTWMMIVAGYVNESPENLAYLERCEQAASRARVEVQTNASLDELQQLYRRACCLWQFTGVNLPFGDAPERCEHLGLVALDCYSYGVIPVVYHRSGMTYLIEHGRNGYCFGGYEELSDIMGLLNRHFGGKLHQEIYGHCLEGAADHDFESFRSSVERVINAEKQGHSDTEPRSTALKSVEHGDGKDDTIRLQARKIQHLLAEAEYLGAERERLATLKRRLSVVHSSPELAVDELLGWRKLGTERLGPNVAGAKEQFDVLWSQRHAMGSPGHRFISYLGRSLRRTALGRKLHSAIKFLMALRQA